MEHRPFPVLHPQESQVARSQIKHVEEHQWVKSDPCLWGCFCAAESHWHSWFKFVALLPPIFLLLMVQSQLCPCADTFPTPLWVWECRHWKEMDKWVGMDISASPPTHYLPLFSLWIRWKREPQGNGTLQKCLFGATSLTALYPVRYCLRSDNSFVFLTCLCLFPFNHLSLLFRWQEAH